MVGIGEDYFGVEVIDEVARGETFDSTLCAYRHEDGGFDGAVSGVKKARAGTGVGAGGLDFETEGGQEIGYSGQERDMERLRAGRNARPTRSVRAGASNGGFDGFLRRGIF